MGKEYDKEALDELCSKIDLLEYASKSFNFKRNSSDSWVTHCPFHVDKTPSLSVNPNANLFHCFSCGVGGGILQWLMRIEGLKYNDAITKLGELTGADIEKLKVSETVKFYKEVKRITTQKDKPKIRNRQILSEDEINEFKDEIPYEWVEEGIDPKTLKKYNIRIDDCANRIVYPVYDSDFNLIGFKGRTRFKNFKEMRIAKYQNYNSIGTTDYFAGMKENISSIKEHNKIIIFEGIKSVMKADGWGYDYCVAAETSTINDEQIKLLIKLGVKEVIIGFDKEVTIKKIRSATKKLCRFTNVYCIIDRFGLLENKMSPVDMGKEVFEKLLEERIKIE